MMWLSPVPEVSTKELALCSEMECGSKTFKVISRRLYRFSALSHSAMLSWKKKTWFKECLSDITSYVTDRYGGIELYVLSLQGQELPLPSVAVDSRWHLLINPAHSHDLCVTLNSAWKKGQQNLHLFISVEIVVITLSLVQCWRRL